MPTRSQRDWPLASVPVGDFRDPAVAASWHASQDSHPARGRQLDLLVELVTRLAPSRLIDLGVGSGLVAERLLDALPSLELVGVDFSAVMLAQAGARLERFGERVTLVERDLTEPGAEPRGFDAAVTVQALHNIPFPGQRRALRFAAEALEPGAVLLSLDKVVIPRPVYELYAALGDFPDSFEEYEARETQSAEHAPSLETYLEWLDEAGFDAGVLDAHAHYALVGARARG
jgi:tRNA (cmo5U34)-methyltransferase